MKRDSNGSAVLLWAALAVFVVWLALLGGGCCGEGLGLFEWLNAFSAALETPFSIHITPYTKKFVLIALAFYGFAVAWYYSEKGNRRPGEEHGSAYWGRPKEVCAHFRTKKNDRYLLISKHIRISMNVRALPPQHQVNANILVIGGSGAGKTRFFIKPNLMQAECSYIVCDPKGETYRAVGGLLEKMGYEVTIFNLIDMKQSDCYNPFAYLHTDIDAFRLINTLIQNTTPQKSQTSDPFWDKAETAFLSALILYLFHEAPESERNFGTLMYMVINAEAREEDESYRSPVDLLFDDLERVDEDHIAVKNWKVFKQAGPKTAKSILISCGARLAVFDIAELREVTAYDELELDTLGDRRTALFLIMSDTDDSFNFLISMCYTQLFNLLCEKADDVYGGRLPVHVRCLIDECANIGQIPKLEKLVATIRSREISACLVLQAQSQLKAIYKDNADTIIGNMDTSIFLGGKEPTTLKELAAVLGKETIDTYNTGENRGRETSHSLNYQKLGKELMSQDELAVMDGGKCILQLRGVRPFLSDKYDITKHPNYPYTADADPKNAFDIEAFLSTRLKLKPNEVYDVYEVDAEGA